MSITSLKRSQSTPAFMQLEQSIKTNTEAWLHMSTGDSKLHAYDDPTAFAMGHQMKSKVTTLNVVLDGITQSKEMLNIAEGSMKKLMDLTDKLNTIIARAKQGLVDDNTIKTALSPSFNLTKQEMIRIVEETEFNGVKLLNGTGGKRNAGTAAMFGSADTLNNQKDYTFSAASAITVKAPSSFGTVSGTTDSTTGIESLNMSGATVKFQATPPITNTNSKVQVLGATIVMEGVIIATKNDTSEATITITGVDLEGTPGIMSADGQKLNLTDLTTTNAIPKSAITVVTKNPQMPAVTDLTFAAPITFADAAVNLVTKTTSAGSSSYSFVNTSAITAKAPTSLTTNSGIVTESKILVSKVENSGTSLNISGTTKYHGANGQIEITGATVKINHAKITDVQGSNDTGNITLTNARVIADAGIANAAGSIPLTNIQVIPDTASVAVDNFSGTFTGVDLKLTSPFIIDSGSISGAIETQASLEASALSAAAVVGAPAFDLAKATITMSAGSVDVDTTTTKIPVTTATGSSTIKTINYTKDMEVLDFGKPEREASTGNLTFIGAKVKISGATITDDATPPNTCVADIIVSNVTINGIPTVPPANSSPTAPVNFIPTLSKPAAGAANYEVTITDDTGGITAVDSGNTPVFKFNTKFESSNATIKDTYTTYPLVGGIGATSTFSFVTGDDLLKSIIDITFANLRLTSNKIQQEDGSFIIIPGLISTLNTPDNILNQHLDNLPDLQSKVDADNSIAYIEAMKDFLIAQLNALGAQQQRFDIIVDQLSIYTEGMSQAEGVFLDADLPKEAEIASQSKAAIDIAVSAIQNLNSLYSALAKLVHN